jgi:two-component system chemotaxis response regulator CheY
MVKPDYTRLNVLVVEDQEMVREIVVTVLRALGCGVIRAAGDGDAALAQVLEQPPDLILCDISMQPVDGFEFVARLAEKGFAGARRIPTIFMTAHSGADMVARAKQVGVDAYIVKPVKRTVLEERIAQVLHTGAR